ncbi:hypothetical protein GALL_237090 [mine drainage metagenome]|uniref:Uncharacterized protein n=1 Tax=mine drainage metagenome TaxID=410659 RepID=A0A1J5RQN3_9ZZZZ
MKQKDEDGIIVPPAANDNGPPSETLDPRLQIIARAIGRQIAREQGAALTAANDNWSEEEGRRPDG